MLNNLKKPCKECPFRKDSAAGWLGPWDAEDLYHTVMGEHDFACHMTMGKDEEDVPEEDQSYCYGSLLFLRKACKMPKFNTALRDARNSVSTDDIDNILTQTEFIDHHTL